MPSRKKLPNAKSGIELKNEDFKSCLIKALSSPEIIDSIASKLNSYLELLVEEKIRVFQNELREDSKNQMEKLKKDSSKLLTSLNEKIEILNKSNEELKIKMNYFEQQALGSSFVLKGADMSSNIAEKMSQNYLQPKQLLLNSLTQN